MEIKRFLLIFSASVVVYFISDYLFNQVMLYVLGGVIWGTFDMLFNIELGLFSGLLIELLTLVGISVLFYRLRNKSLKYFTIILIAGLLYIIDFLLMNLVSYDPEIENRIILDSSFKSGVFMAFSTLLKSLVLSLIIYFEERKKKKATN